MSAIQNAHLGGLNQRPKHDHFGLPIPSCWYLKTMGCPLRARKFVLLPCIGHNAGTLFSISKRSSFFSETTNPLTVPIAAGVAGSIAFIAIMIAVCLCICSLNRVTPRVPAPRGPPLSGFPRRPYARPMGRRFPF